MSFTDMTQYPYKMYPYKDQRVKVKHLL